MQLWIGYARIKARRMIYVLELLSFNVQGVQHANMYI